MKIVLKIKVVSYGSELSLLKLTKESKHNSKQPQHSSQNQTGGGIIVLVVLENVTVLPHRLSVVDVQREVRGEVVEGEVELVARLVEKVLEFVLDLLGGSVLDVVDDVVDVCAVLNRFLGPACYQERREAHGHLQKSMSDQNSR